MKRINVTFYDETIGKLEERAQKNKNKSIATDIRELVDLGLKIEEASQKNDGEDDFLNLKKISELLVSNMTWSLEARLLSRYLVENLPSSDEKNHLDILEKYKEKAKNYVEGLIDAR